MEQGLKGGAFQNQNNRSQEGQMKLPGVWGDGKRQGKVGKSCVCVGGRR